MWWAIGLVICVVVVVLLARFVIDANRRHRDEEEARRARYAGERSPFAFIGDELWLAWRVYAGEALGVGPSCLTEMNLVPVSGSPPSQSVLAECARQLTEVKAEVFLLGPGDWPVCCDRLATLMALDDVDEAERLLGPSSEYVAIDSSDAAKVRFEPFRIDAGTLVDGTGFFQCAACKRAWVAFHEP